MTLTTEEQQALEREARIRYLAPEMLDILDAISRYGALMDRELSYYTSQRIRRVLKEANRA